MELAGSPRRLIIKRLLHPQPLNNLREYVMGILFIWHQVASGYKDPEPTPPPNHCLIVNILSSVVFVLFYN